VVLGAGGVVGGAFHAGVLGAIAEVTGWDPRTADVIVGTSAGSITGVSLRAGLSAGDLFARAEGRPLSPDGARLLRSLGPPGRPPRRARGLRWPPSADMLAMLRQAVARPFGARPVALLAGLMPEGTVGTEFIERAIAAITTGGWPSDPLWICAVRRSDGRLVAFGRDRDAPLAQAVAASCAIPGYFRSVDIDGEAYVDGGAHSPTNADLLTSSPPELVLVSSPMSSAGPAWRIPATQPVRRWSRALLDTEALRLRRRGVHVIAFQPTPPDIAIMGLNALDADRRALVARQAYESTLRRLERADTRQRLEVLFAARQARPSSEAASG
jgi:NTE family protein